MTRKKIKKQLETPKKQQIIGAKILLDKKGIKTSQNELAKHLDVSRKQVRNALNSDTFRTKKTSELKRYNNMKLTERDIHRVSLWLKKTDDEGHILNWHEVVQEFGFEVCARTLQRRMSVMCVAMYQAACKPFITTKDASLRLEWASNMLKKYPKAEDWRHVRFSDEVHFGWGPAGQRLVLRHRGPQWRYHPACIQRLEVRDIQGHLKDPKNEGKNTQKRLHYWAAIGYDYKSPLVRYEVPGNTNGKMTQQIYVEQILEPIVGDWIKEGTRFCLEEDNDSGHGTRGHDNAVSKWKKAHNIATSGQSQFTCYPNCPRSPDLAPIEDCWMYPKNYVKQRPHWDDEIVHELAVESWAKLSQKRINELVDSMPQRLQDVITSKGQLVERR